MLQVKIKKVHVDAVIPTYAKPGDAGMDLTAIDAYYEEETSSIVYDTGLQLEIPEGYVGLLFPRSSLSKYELIQTNHVGVIDSGYRGNIMIKFKPSFDYWDTSKDEDFQSQIAKGKFEFFSSAEDQHYNRQLMSKIYGIGDRVGQIIIIPHPKVEFVETDILTSTIRGEGGYGSTGK